MNRKCFDIKAALLKSGKEEFLLYGFERASLRAICKKANVTTGSFYAYFENKEQLFNDILEPTLAEFYKMYSGVVQKAMADVRNNESNELEAIEFLCEHRDNFRLLFDCSGGTRYAGFREYLLESIFINSYQKCFDKYAGRHVDPAVVRLFVQIKFTQYMELIYGGYTAEEIRHLISLYASFTEAGFTKLIEQSKEEITEKDSRSETVGSLL